MKKFLIILCCVALLLPVAALSAFAEGGFSFDYSRSGTYSPDCDLFLNSVVFSGSSSYSSSVSSGTVFRILCTEEFSSYEVYLNGSLVTTLGEDDSYDLSIVGNTSVIYDDTTTSFSISMVIPPDPVGDGVDSSISFTGQVLHFLATNTTTIVLIGLSVAMFAVLPFAISKIKQMIKGY